MSSPSIIKKHMGLAQMGHLSNSRNIVGKNDEQCRSPTFLGQTPKIYRQFTLNKILNPKKSGSISPKAGFKKKDGDNLIFSTAKSLASSRNYNASAMKMNT